MSANLSDHVYLIDYPGNSFVNFETDYSTHVLSQAPGHCRMCADRIKPFTDSGFYEKADRNNNFHVTTENSCLCERCYNEKKSKAKPAEGLEPLKILYRYNYTGEDTLVHEVVCYH